MSSTDAQTAQETTMDAFRRDILDIIRKLETAPPAARHACARDRIMRALTHETLALCARKSL